MSQATIAGRGKAQQASASRYGLYAGVVVLILGPVLSILFNGPQILGTFAFWFGLYGWLVAGIVVGYLVYLALATFAPQTMVADVTVAPDTPALSIGAKVPAGELPPWEAADLPAAPRFSLRSALLIIGPGAILLGTSIGSGEWLIGPAVTARCQPRCWDGASFCTCIGAWAGRRSVDPGVCKLFGGQPWANMFFASPLI